MKIFFSHESNVELLERIQTLLDQNNVTLSREISITYSHLFL
jgi:hypothetical protein